MRVAFLLAILSIACCLWYPHVLDYVRSHVQDEFDALKSKHEEEKRTSENVVASINTQLEHANRQKAWQCPICGDNICFGKGGELCDHYKSMARNLEIDLANAKAGFTQEPPRMRLLDKWLNERSTLRQLIDLFKLRQ
jgi:predicted RNA-binding Zn-ribbon protein involved in translation (DUF1610 family)